MITDDSNNENLADSESFENQSADTLEPELGQTRMEVAYGAGDGDDDAKAVVARKASMGVLYEQIYRPWNGELGPRWVRNYAIFRHHVYGLFKGTGHRHYNPFVRLSILVIFLTSLTPIAMIFLSVTILEERVLIG